MQSDVTDPTLDTSLTDETAKLRELEANVRNQDELERELGRQVLTFPSYYEECICLIEYRMRRPTSFLLSKPTSETRNG